MVVRLEGWQGRAERLSGGYLAELRRLPGFPLVVIHPPDRQEESAVGTESPCRNLIFQRFTQGFSGGRFPKAYSLAGSRLAGVGQQGAAVGAKYSVDYHVGMCEWLASGAARIHVPELGRLLIPSRHDGLAIGA
jgi:hypothetical protein